MKKIDIFVVIISGIILLSACDHGGFSSKLTMVDSLATTSPDSARTLISRMGDDTLGMTIRELMYYKLIRLKADVEGTRKRASSAEAKRLLSYYENNADKKLLPQVYYCVAGMYRNMNDAPQALDYYHKAIEMMSDNQDLQLRSRIFRQVGNLFLSQGMDELSYTNFHASYQIDSACHDTAGMVRSLVDMSKTRRKKDIDKGIVFLKTANELNRKTGYGLDDVIENRLSELYNERCQYDSAWVYLQKYLRDNTTVDSCSVFSIAANIALGKGHLDSARYYNLELMRMGTVYDKKDAAKSLATLAFKEDRFIDGFKYTNLYYVFSDSVEKMDVKQAMALSNSLYNYQLSGREVDHLRITQRRNAVLFMTFTLVGFIVMLILAYKNIKAKQNQEQMELKMLLMEKKTDELEAQSKSEIERRKKEIDRLTDELLDTQKDKNEIERQLEEEKAKLGEAMMNRQRVMERKMEVDNELQATKAVGLAKSKLKLQKHLTRAEWTEVEDELEELLGDFRVFLYNAYELSEQEYHICLLIKLGFKNNEIGTLTSREPNAISLARKRLYKKLTGSDGSAADLDLFVRGL